MRDVTGDGDGKEGERRRGCAHLHGRAVGAVFEQSGDDERGKAVEQGGAMRYVYIDGRAMLRAVYDAFVFEDA